MVQYLNSKKLPPPTQLIKSLVGWLEKRTRIGTKPVIFAFPCIFIALSGISCQLQAEIMSPYVYKSCFFKRNSCHNDGRDAKNNEIMRHHAKVNSQVSKTKMSHLPTTSCQLYGKNFQTSWKTFQTWCNNAKTSWHTDKTKWNDCPNILAYVSKPDGNYPRRQSLLLLIRQISFKNRHTYRQI